MPGWIKLYRDITDHWIWKSQNRFQWWIDILLTVNHSDSKVLIRGKLIECKRGQSVMSLETWARRWNVTKKTVKDFFDLLQTDSMIIYENMQITTRITVCNYSNYQSEVNGQEIDSKRSVNGQETVTTPKQEGIRMNNNEKKIKYADFVSMQTNEFETLVSEHGNRNTKLFIEILNNYKGSKGTKYKNDYRAILSWVIDKTKKEGKYEGKPVMV
jgi:hypothetical protein